MHSSMIHIAKSAPAEQSAACRRRRPARHAMIRATQCVVERMESRVLLSIALAPESGLSASGGTFAVMAGATVNVALNRPAVASTIETSGLAASKATDGSTSTRWSSNAFDPQWIYVDLGQNYDINRVVLRWETAYGKDFQIQVSNDASTWTTITSVTGGTGGVNDLSGLSGTGRYVRMYGTARGTKYGYSLWEFEVYGTVSAVQPPNVAYDLLATSLSTTNALDGQTVTVGYQISSPAVTDAVLSLTLTGPGGVSVPDVGPRVSITVQPGTNWYYRDILIDLPPNAPAGAYSVTWQVSSLSGVARSSTSPAYLTIATPISVTVPILIYHSVDDIAYSQFYITTAAFQSQMQTLHDNGYTTITLQDWANIRAGLEAAPAKPVIITFDDGLDNLLTKAYPILSSFGFKATSFVPTEYVGGTNAWDVGSIAAGDPVINELTWSQIQQLAATGLIDFESHSMTHPDLTAVDDSQLAWELVGSKQALESHLPGHQVLFIAYPFGSGAGDARVENATYNAGYFGGIAAGGGVDLGSSDKYNLLRVEVSTSDTGEAFLEKLGTTATQPPAAPTGLTATAISSSQINLAWTDNATTETGFAIDYATDVNFTQNLITTTVGASSGSSASASITGLSPSTSYYFRVRATNSGGASANSNTASATTSSINHTPTDIALSSSSIPENQPVGTAAGGFSTTDPDVGNTFTYTLVSGIGSTDNASFTMSGNQLLTAASFDYEAKNSYSIRVRTTDQGGLWVEKSFTISVLNVAEVAPTITGISTDTGVSSSDGITSDPTLLINGTSEPGMTITVYRGGVLAGTTSANGSGNWVFDYTGTSLGDGSYSFTATAGDTLGHTTAASAPYAVTIDTAAPRVTAVYVRGSTWTSGFLSFLAANLSGSSSTYGFTIPVGSGGTQLQTLPWRNINRISVAFGEDVSVAQAQLAISGSVGSYSISGFSYNVIDHVATWSLSAVIGPDKLYIALPGSGATPVTDTAGNALDGEWTNPSSFTDVGASSTFPSGNGVAGGDFAFRFDVLPGDSTGGSLGKVNVADVAQTKSRSSLPETTSSYRSDFDGNNLINVADVAYVKSKSSIYSLPLDPPVLPLGSSVNLLLSPADALLGNRSHGLL